MGRIVNPVLNIIKRKDGKRGENPVTARARLGNRLDNRGRLHSHTYYNDKYLPFPIFLVFKYLWLYRLQKTKIKRLFIFFPYFQKWLLQVQGNAPVFHWEN